MSILKGLVGLIPASEEDLLELQADGKNLDPGEIWINYDEDTLYYIDPNTGQSKVLSTANTAIDHETHNTVIETESNEVEFTGLVDFDPINDYSMIITNTTSLVKDVHFQWVYVNPYYKAVRIDGGIFQSADDVQAVIIKTFLTSGSTIGSNITYLDNVYTHSGADISQLPLPESFDTLRDSIDVIRPNSLVSTSDYTIDIDNRLILFDTFNLTNGDDINLRVWKMVRNELAPLTNGYTINQYSIPIDRLEEFYARLISRDYKIVYDDYATLSASLLDGKAVTSSYLRPNDSTIFGKFELSVINATTTKETRTIYDSNELVIIIEEKTYTYDGSGNVLTESQWMEI